MGVRSWSTAKKIGVAVAAVIGAPILLAVVAAGTENVGLDEFEEVAPVLVREVEALAEASAGSYAYSDVPHEYEIGDTPQGQAVADPGTCYGIAPEDGDPVGVNYDVKILGVKPGDADEILDRAEAYLRAQDLEVYRREEPTFFTRVSANKGDLFLSVEWANRVAEMEVFGSGPCVKAPGET